MVRIQVLFVVSIVGLVAAHPVITGNALDARSEEKRSEDVGYEGAGGKYMLFVL